MQFNGEQELPLHTENNETIEGDEFNSTYVVPYRAETGVMENKSRNRVITAKLPGVNVLEQFSYDNEEEQRTGQEQNRQKPRSSN